MSGRRNDQRIGGIGAIDANNQFIQPSIKFARFVVIVRAVITIALERPF